MSCTWGLQKLLRGLERLYDFTTFLVGFVLDPKRLACIFLKRRRRVNTCANVAQIPDRKSRELKCYTFVSFYKSHVDLLATSYLRSCRSSASYTQYTAIQGIDCGPERERNIDRKSMLPSYASHLHPKPRLDRFHTNDFTVPEANLYAHG